MPDLPAKEPAWYVFYTASRHEKKAAERLSQQGFEVYLPLVTEMKQWSDRKKKVQAPLFKSYLFVFTLPSEIQRICGFPGIAAAVKNAGKYATVRPAEIDAIRRLVSSGIHADVIPGEIAEGDTVIIEEGPLRGLSGKCLLESGQNYFFIEVPSVNHLIRVKIHASLMRKSTQK